MADLEGAEPAPPHPPPLLPGTDMWQQYCMPLYCNINIITL